MVRLWVEITWLCWYVPREGRRKEDGTPVGTGLPERTTGGQERNIALPESHEEGGTLVLVSYSGLDQRREVGRWTSPRCRRTL
jgi:hypothetical protein